MIRADQIPPEVVEAAAISLRGGWGEADEAEKEAYREAARASIAAALNAWPGAQEKPYWDFRTGVRHAELILPLPQEPQQ